VGAIVTNDLPHHPLADLFPLWSETSCSYAAFKESVGVHGVDPIVMYEGKVLGGRLRLRACRDLGIEPLFVDYDGDDPLGFVLRDNLNRRHLTPAYVALLVEENTFWAPHGGDRKSTGFLQLRSSASLAFDPLKSFDSVIKLHTARERKRKDEDGNDVPNTKALLPEVIEAVRALKIEKVGTVRWLAEQTYEHQRKFLVTIKRKDEKDKPKSGKRGSKTKIQDFAQWYDGLSDEEQEQVELIVLARREIRLRARSRMNP
jgi:hypothetical protein